MVSRTSRTIRLEVCGVPFPPQREGEHPNMDDQIVAGARDAAKQLGYAITATSTSHAIAGAAHYGFTFDASGREARVEFVVNEADVKRFGLTVREYARWEVLDALRGPER
jgi:hypothetical protein